MRVVWGHLCALAEEQPLRNPPARAHLGEQLGAPVEGSHKKQEFVVHLILKRKQRRVLLRLGLPAALGWVQSVNSTCRHVKVCLVITVYGMRRAPCLQIQQSMVLIMVLCFLIWLAASSYISAEGVITDNSHDGPWKRHSDGSDFHLYCH